MVSSVRNTDDLKQISAPGDRWIEASQANYNRRTREPAEPPCPCASNGSGVRYRPGRR